MNRRNERREPHPNFQTLDYRIKTTREISKKSENVFLVDHAKDSMKKRNITMPQILDTLRQGKGSDGIPYTDSYGDIRTVFMRQSAGVKVKVVVVVKKNKLLVITIM